MDNVQNCDIYINIPSSQAYKSFSVRLFVLFHTDVSFMLVATITSKGKRVEIWVHTCLWTPGSFIVDKGSSH
jgi:hypothetical protein